MDLHKIVQKSCNWTCADNLQVASSSGENVNFFEMDKDTETSSRGDRDLSEEMIRIEDHILLPFYDL